jgi:translation initiation factor eIF-2B subunit delta
MAVGGDKPDRISGSVDLFDQAGESLREQLLRRGTSQVTELLDALETEHPSMALRLNLIAAVREALLSGREEALAALETFGQEVIEGRVAVASRFASLVHEKGWKVAATYSRSGQVREAFSVARRAGLERVILSEARPAGEGYLLAAELRAEGYEVEITADAALPVRLSWVQVLVVGADACFQGGFANKMGTAILLREARRLGLETVVLTLPQKALRGTAEQAWKNLSMEPPKEARKLRRGITWSGDLFEVVPWDLATVVIGRA